MKTPEEIQAEYSKVTDRQVQDVVIALNKTCPDKELWAAYQAGKNDGLDPYVILKHILSSTADWFHYGN